MSNEKKIMLTAGAASAPIAQNNVTAGGYSRPPPPSYEESQRMYGSPTNRVVPNHMIPSYMTPTYNCNGSHQLRTSNFTSNYAAPPPPQYYQNQYVSATAPITFNHVQVVKEAPVLTLAPGAKVRTTSGGAVSIPPPPPGCAPSAAQYAAMQGQPVVLKKTKRSFF